MNTNQELFQNICESQTIAIARAITLVENREPGYLSLLNLLYQIPKQSCVMGITGSPGSGKSTFINQLVHQGFEQGKKIAIIAIDPTSRFSGGALLGDRIRFSDHYPKDRVFFRSMASKWNHSSINPSLFHTIQVFNAAKFDWIIVESVGAGQNDMEIRDYVDLILLLLVSSMGDDIQCMKAGIMEIADFFVINKIDIHPAESLKMALLSSLSQNTLEEKMLETDSIHGKGFSHVLKKIEAWIQKNPSIFSRNPSKDTQLILASELEWFFSEKHIQSKFQKLVSHESSPYQVVEKVNVLLSHVLEQL